MTCPECNGRGWVPRFKGDMGGDVCMACADPALVSGPPTERRNKGKGRKSQANSKPNAVATPVPLGYMGFSTSIRPHGGGRTRGR